MTAARTAHPTAPAGLRSATDRAAESAANAGHPEAASSVHFSPVPPGLSTGAARRPPYPDQQSTTATIGLDPLRRLAAVVDGRTAALVQQAVRRTPIGVARSAVIRRAPSVESMDAAWGEMTAKVDGTTMVSFIEHLRRHGHAPDGGGGFSWQDFLRVLGSERGTEWVKDKWRDLPNTKWGEDQEIQGQHEWIKTDDVAYVIRTVVLTHKGANLAAWLSACDMLRIPTSDVLFPPRINPETIERANTTPVGFTISQVGGFSGHIGAVYQQRTTPHATDPHKYANRPLTTGEKSQFHNPMHQLLETHLNATKNDLPGFLTAIKEFQEKRTWGGDIPDLKVNAAQQIPNDLRAGQTSTAGLYGSYRSEYHEGVGISTTFMQAPTLHDFQQVVREAKERNSGIMERRVNALVQFIQPTSIAISSQWSANPTGQAYVVDAAGKTTEDYDTEAGYNSMNVEPNPHGPYDPIGDDVEPDEEYSAAPERPRPGPSAMAGPRQFPQKLLDDYGQKRSELQQQQEEKIKQINKDVNAMFAMAYQAETQALGKKVDDALAQLDPNDPGFGTKKEQIFAEAITVRQGIDLKYKAEGERLFQQYIDKKRRRDVLLNEEHPRQVTHADLDALLESYLRDTTLLLDAYVADVKKSLNIT